MGRGDQRLPDQPATWWAEAERLTFGGEGEVPALDPDGSWTRGIPAWLAGLTHAHALELTATKEEARAALSQCATDVPEAWRDVHRLLELRGAVRAAQNTEELERLHAEIEGLIGRIPPDQQPTLARTHHLHGIVLLRLERTDDAEVALGTALGLVEEAPTRTWILDGFGQALAGQGAWVEAGRTLDYALATKERVGDVLGVAITAGTLARLHISLGRPEAALDVLRGTLGRVGGRLGADTRMRLVTALLEAGLDANDANEVRRQVRVLETLLQERPGRRHYLCGFAALALARAAGRDEDEALVRERLDEAARHLLLPEQLALLKYWEARLLPEVAERADWLASLESTVAGVGGPTEAELRAHVLVAERAAARDDVDEMRRHLDRALDLATRSNNRLWLDRVDDAYGRHDPQRFAARIVERFSGRTAEELGRTTSEEATVVFADLVQFTKRSVELEPEEVMTTVRSLFELSVPLNAAFQVQPISYLGDGLLAVAQGPDHGARGLAFAKALLQRAGRVSACRRAMGERWGLDLRAGVASGPLVLGTLGSHYKMEYLAIGLTTNLAARLQAKAEPGEVMCACTAVPVAPEGATEELLDLKGFPESVPALRIRVGPA